MRYTALSDDDRKSMLKTIGIKSVDELFSSLPKKIRLFDLPTHKSEIEVERDLKEISRKNGRHNSKVCPGHQCYSYRNYNYK